MSNPPRPSSPLLGTAVPASRASGAVSSGSGGSGTGAPGTGAQRSSGETRQSPPPERTPVNILLVDDRPENLLALEAILEPLDERLVRASSGEEALKELLRADFAVILLDVQMPGMNGFELAQLIKARERTRATPIIFLTAISKEEAYVFRGYEVGAVDYMSKPFQPDILRSKVAVFVELYRKGEQLRRQDALIREGQQRELELRHRAELQESQARMADVVGSAMDAIVIFDASHHITVFNAAAERMFGMSAEEAVGRDVGELFPEDGREGQVAELTGEGVGREGGDQCLDPAVAQPLVRTLTGLHRDGSRFPLEATVSCLTLADGRSFTLIGRDITERVRTEEALRQHAESLARTTADLKVANEELQSRQLELERAMNARNRFYASMSHELRTPINAIIGYNTLLLDNIYGPLNERQIQGLQRTHKAAKHLLELVNDVLDLSKIEAGKIELSLQPVSFPTMVEDLFVTVRPLADEHGTELHLRNDGEEARTVITDPRRVRQILLNLLSNAIKFGRGKPIHVECSTGPLGGVQIDVIDQGQGIAAKDIARIFDEFVQLSSDGQSTGTGLGLPISRRLATLLNGRLEVESTVGEGSRFRLVLPPAADGRLPRDRSANAGTTPAEREVKGDAKPEPKPEPKGDGKPAAAANGVDTGTGSRQTADVRQ